MIINGEGITLGRLASFAAKSALKGEEIIILNCKNVIISGNKKNIEQEFKEKRSKMGSSLKGPKHSRDSEKIVKRAIRGMLPDYREGRGTQAFKRVKCYAETPKEFEGKETFNLKKETKIKSIKVSSLEKRK